MICTDLLDIKTTNIFMTFNAVMILKYHDFNYDHCFS